MSRGLGLSYVATHHHIPENRRQIASRITHLTLMMTAAASARNGTARIQVQFGSTELQRLAVLFSTIATLISRHPILLILAAIIE